MIESALIFATVVQLLGVWRAEREALGKSKKLDTAEFISWMKQHNFDEVARAVEQSGAILDDLRNDTGAINSKLDHIIEILSGGDVSLDVSPEMVQFMNWMKPVKKKVQINESLAMAMVKLVDERFHGLALFGDLGGKRLVAFKPGENVTLEVDDDDWSMMKSDLETLVDAGIFDIDYEMEYDRFMVTRALEELVNEKVREHLNYSKEGQDETA